jgi:hypothetical protein
MKTNELVERSETKYFVGYSLLAMVQGVQLVTTMTPVTPL